MAAFECKVMDKRTDKFYPHLRSATQGSAAIDLRAMLDHPLLLQPGDCELVGSGLAIWTQSPQLAGLILPRSGLGHKHGIILGNCVGLIDSDYQGELKISVWNRSNSPYTIEPGERIAQFMVVPVIETTLNVVSEFSDGTGRGESGFGSTGRKGFF